MEREIKFRGKRTDTKEWIYGFYAKTVTSEEINCVADCRKQDIIIDEHGTFYYVIPETVGQYTGLKDKAGKEIYEGIKIKHENPKPFKESIYNVLFLNGGFAIQNDDYVEDLNEFLKNSNSAKVIED